MIQPVKVVPKLAPITTPMAWLNVIKPALTKPIKVIVVAEDDCTKAVIVAPDKKALKGVPVNRASAFCNEDPAKVVKPSLSKDIPIRNKPMPPSS